MMCVLLVLVGVGVLGTGMVSNWVVYGHPLQWPRSKPRFRIKAHVTDDNSLNFWVEGPSGYLRLYATREEAETYLKARLDAERKARAENSL